MGGASGGGGHLATAYGSAGQAPGNADLGETPFSSFGSVHLHSGRSSSDGGDDDVDSVSSDMTFSYTWSGLSSFARPGFLHTLTSFATSAVVINTTSTYLDSVLSLRGRSHKYTAFVGFAFQIIVMASSTVMGSITDR